MLSRDKYALTHLMLETKAKHWFLFMNSDCRFHFFELVSPRNTQYLVYIQGLGKISFAKPRKWTLKRLNKLSAIHIFLDKGYVTLAILSNNPLNRTVRNRAFF